MLYGAHVTDYGRNLGGIPDPAQSPFSQRARLRSIGPYLGYRLRWLLSESPSPKWLSDNHCQPLISGIFQSADAGVVIYIHVAVLKLAKSPVIVVIEYLPEGLKIIVEGEPNLAD